MEKYGSKRVHTAVFIGTLGPYQVNAPDNPEDVDAKVFEDIKAAIRADRPAFLMEFLRNFYNYDVTGGKLVGERVLEDNWNIAAGASAIGTVTCVDCWIEDFRKDVKRTTCRRSNVRPALSGSEQPFSIFPTKKRSESFLTTSEGEWGERR